MISLLAQTIRKFKKHLEGFKMLLERIRCFLLFVSSENNLLRALVSDMSDALY